MGASRIVHLTKFCEHDDIKENGMGGREEKCIRVVIPGEEFPLRRLRKRRGGKIRVDQKEIEWGMRSGFIWLRIKHRRDRVNTVMNFRTVQTGRELPDKLSN